MIATFIALVALTGAQAQDSPRRKTMLPNNSIVFVEHIPSPVLSVQLIASARGVEEKPTTHGLRHLLEHLILRGRDGRLDTRLESQGMFFTGRTYRDAMQIEVFCTATQLDIALDAIREVLSPRPFSAGEIEKELRVLTEELAMQSDAVRLSSAAWTTAFGPGGLDPLGDLGVMAKVATDASLQEVRARHFHPANLVLSISGDVELGAVTAKASALLSTLTRQNSLATAPPPERQGKPARGEAASAFGECRAAISNGAKTKETAAQLCAAFAIANKFPTAFVTYTPTLRIGLVILGRTDERSGIGLFIDELTDGDISALFPIGKALGQEWLRKQLSDSEGNSWLRGLLLCQSPVATPDIIQENLESLSFSDFRAGVRSFNKDRAIVISGGR